MNVNIINCDAPPYVPDGWEVVEHRKGGQFKWDKEAQKDALYLSAAQKKEKGSIEGSKLRKELAGRFVLNANVLDYLLAHTELIPEDLEGKYVFFWGTIYLDSHGRSCVRCLYRDGCGWHDGNYMLDGDWDGSSPAALRA